MTTLIEFGEIRFHDIASGEISVHEVRVVIPDGWKPIEDDSYEAELKPVIRVGSVLAVSMPWGPLELSLPLPQVVLLELPA